MQDAAKGEQMAPNSDQERTSRRTFLFHGVATGGAALLPLRLDGLPVRRPSDRPVRTTPRPDVPPTQVCLADFGGTPGTKPAALVDAFGRGFAALTAAGGGTLLVPAGIYNFGRYAQAENVILCRDLRDVVISAYGAVFRATTTARVVPHLFYFFNFNNVTLAGASFEDGGFTPWVEWQGMYCTGIQADKPSSGFHLIDCHAQRVVGLLASNNNAGSRHFLSDIHVEGKVQNAYYGVCASWVRENISVALDCHNVRRAFIAYGLKNTDVAVRASNTVGWPGSNGFVALVCAGASLGNVENVRVAVDVSGASIHSSYVHFYHQGPQHDGVMQGIDATVNAIDMEPMNCLFLFDHETDGVQPVTARTWNRISLHGSVPRGFDGRVISNTSVSMAPGTVVVDRNLVQTSGMARLARSFRVKASPNTVKR